MKILRMMNARRLATNSRSPATNSRAIRLEVCRQGTYPGCVLTELCQFDVMRFGNWPAHPSTGRGHSTGYFLLNLRGEQNPGQKWISTIRKCVLHLGCYRWRVIYCGGRNKGGGGYETWISVSSSVNGDITELHFNHSRGFWLMMQANI